MGLCRVAVTKIFMGYRHKTSEPFAEFTHRDHGIAEYSELSIELETTYCPEFNDALKALLRHGSERTFSPALRRWFIAPAALDRAVELAKHYYRLVYIVNGESIVEQISGREYSAPKLF